MLFTVWSLNNKIAFQELKLPSHQVVKIAGSMMQDNVAKQGNVNINKGVYPPDTENKLKDSHECTCTALPPLSATGQLYCFTTFICYSAPILFYHL